jgi:cell division protein ZapA (FtsZ GTPase activity inhibitor)
MGMKLEDIGRSLDNEIDKLRKFIEQEVRPETRKEMADFLRRASERLTKLAEKVDEPKH